MADPGTPRAVDTAALLRKLGVNLPGPIAIQKTTAATAPAPRFDPSGEPARPLRGDLSSKKVLHITNGDVAADLIRLSGLPGTVSITADVLHEGPAPAGLPPERWRKVRARYLAESGYDDYDRCLASLTEWDHRIESATDYDEVILWFEHDLFDQLLLIRILDWFAGRNLGGTELSLLCIGEFPGVLPFHGLGDLTPEQIASLADRRRRVNEAQKLLARDAWRAFCASSPAALEEVLRQDTSLLPFLAGALRRHLEEFPAVANGLSRTERQALQGVAAGHATFEILFAATQRMEERVFLGDASFLRNLRVLASGSRPLLRLESAPGSSLRSMRITLTTTGRDVLENRDDWVHIHGLDHWLGGVHLQGSEAAWRWDAAAGRLKSSRK
ncbi:MAG TPA: DUF1835 domain-containing protein [Thermoanaerobaculia bacterium]|nr:DUF1835 domain-containing protein [Thermoanaerobaculia bacterium]